MTINTTINFLECIVTVIFQSTVSSFMAFTQALFLSVNSFLMKSFSVFLLLFRFFQIFYTPLNDATTKFLIWKQWIMNYYSLEILSLRSYHHILKLKVWISLPQLLLRTTITFLSLLSTTHTHTLLLLSSYQGLSLGHYRMAAIMPLNGSILVILSNYLSQRENNITLTGSAWQHK